MDLTTLIKEIKKEAEINLAEEEAVELMFSYPRPKSNKIKKEFPEAKLSAVNILLFEHNNQILFPVIKRPKYDGHHSQQISLPGGKYEISDENLNFTSKRETFEEIGIDVNHQKTITKLSEIYIPPSNFIVSPFITVYKKHLQPAFIKDDYEVDEIIYINILDIINHNNIIEKDVLIKNKTSITVKAYNIENEIIWGATGIILAEFSIILNRILKKNNIPQINSK